MGETVKMNENEEILTILKSHLIVAFIVLLTFFILLFLVSRIIRFMEERKYIKMEMERTEGNEYLYWRHKLKLLYLGSIPLFGAFLYRWYDKK